jgi:hypothetical protein
MPEVTITFQNRLNALKDGVAADKAGRNGIVVFQS